MIDVHTRGLARQHRYVIKDHFLHYDVFVSFEDDMLIQGAHVSHFVELTEQLYLLRQEAPDRLPSKGRVAAGSHYHGPLTKHQYMRLVPGFFRVEAALPGWKPHQENLYERIPIDYEWNGATNVTLDPLCCQVSPETANHHIPYGPTADDLYFWETSIDALGVRNMPDDAGIGWVLMQAGNSPEGSFRDSNYIVGEYWSGLDHYFDQPRQPRTKGRYLNNQGGWMATPRQLFEWHTIWCPGSGFLPPYDPKEFNYDGLDSQSVEYWSGGIHIVGPKSCNLQRIIPLEPDMFAKHLLYHTSNNKQRQDSVQHRFSSRSIHQFWGQLNTVRKNAERALSNA